MSITLDPIHVTQTAAISAYVTLGLAVNLGILRGILHKTRGRSSWMLDDLHQFAGLLAIALVMLHLVALAIAPHITFPAFAVIAPIGDPQRPIAHALGALGLYALVIVMVSSWLRRRLPYKLWRGLHTLSFVAFCVVTPHGLLASGASAPPWTSAMYLTGALSVALLIAIYVCAPQYVKAATRLPATAASRPISQ